MTARELRELGSKWQEKLNLTRYSLDIRFDKRMRAKDGLVIWNEDNPSISVKIKGSIEPSNIEETVIHELLHPLFQVEGHDPLYEGAFNIIARALVNK